MESASNTLKSSESLPKKDNSQKTYEWELVWRNILIFMVLHIVAVYGIYTWVTFKCKLSPIIFNFLCLTVGTIGTAAGAHRMWCHKAFKANLGVRIFLMLGQTVAVQNDIYVWSRDHRVHHKFSDTDADPHNASRGFFFSHMGWLMLKKHPDVLEKGKTIDMSDILADPVVKFQRKFYVPMVVIFNQLIPIFVSYYFLKEDLVLSVVTSVTRYVLHLHGVWTINSVSHLWGMKPYDKNIGAVEANKFTCIYTLGEAFHNYHHSFPWDYKASEFSDYSFVWTTKFIELMAWCGWVTELKTTSPELIRKRALRTGDGTWSGIQKNENNEGQEDDKDEPVIWGWGDKDIPDDEKKLVHITHITAN